MKIKNTIIILITFFAIESIASAHNIASRFIISFSKKNDEIVYRINHKTYKYSEIEKILSKIDKDLYVYIYIENDFSKDVVVKILEELKKNKIKKGFLVIFSKKDGEDYLLEIPIDIMKMDVKVILDIPIPKPPEPEEEIKKK